MATIQDQISQARAAGYDDAAIAAHLSNTPDLGPKMKTALDAGYKPAEILSHLSGERAPRGTAMGEEAPRTVGGFLSNVGKSAGHLVGGLATAIAHPLDTLGGTLDIAAGALQKALPKALVDFVNQSETPEALAAGQRAIKTAEAAGGVYKSKYGSVDAIKKTLYEDPVGAAADLSMLLTGGAGLARGAATATRAVPSVSAAATTAAKGLGAAATYTNPLSAVPPIAGAANYVARLVPGVAPTLDVGGKVLGKAAQGAYNIVEPMLPGGAAAIKSRAYSQALDNDPVKINAAIQMLQSGMTIEETAAALQSSGLAAFAKTSQDASTAVQDLYGARAAALQQRQANQLGGAQQSLNALEQQQREGISATGAVSPNEPRNVINRSLSEQEKTLAAQQQELAKGLPNVSPMATGEELAAKAAQGLTDVQKKIVTPAYTKAFDLAGSEPIIPFESVLGTAKGQRAETITALKGLAPETSRVLELFAPTVDTFTRGLRKGQPRGEAPAPAKVTLEQADALGKALNMDYSALAGATDAASNIARKRIGDMRASLIAAIDEGLPAAANDAYRAAKELHGTQVADVFYTGAPANLRRTTSVGEPVLKAEDIVGKVLGSENDARQFLKVYSKDPAAMQTLKTGLENEYRSQVIDPKTGHVDPGKHASFMASNEHTLTLLDEAGMGIAKSLEKTGAAATDLAAADAALTAKASQLKFPTVTALRTALVKDPVKMAAGLQEMNAPAKAALARGLLEDASAKGAKMLEHLNNNEQAIKMALSAADPKTAASVLSEIKQIAELRALAEQTGNKLGAATPQNALAASQKLASLTQELPKVRAVIADIQAQLKAGETFDSLAAKGKAAGGTSLRAVSESTGKTPGSLSKIGMIANMVLNRVKGGLDNKLAVEIAKELLQSETAAAALTKAQVAPVKQAAGTNSLRTPMLATMQQANQNALIPRFIIGGIGSDQSRAAP